MQQISYTAAAIVESADSVFDVVPAGCCCLSACAVPHPASAVAAAEVDPFGPVLSVQHRDSEFKYIIGRDVV